MSKTTKRKHRQQIAQRRATQIANSTPQADKRQRINDTSRNKMWMVAGLALVAGFLIYALTGSGGGSKSEASRTVAVPTNSIAPTSTVATAKSTAPTQAIPKITQIVSNAPGPRIRFANKEHDFGKITGGDVPKHTYVFTNVGDRVLEITAVQPGCGCTTPGEWTKKVEPGQTGSIPIAFNSANFSGQVGKTITVICNDSTEPTVMLQLKANIWKAIDVSPQFAILNVTAEAQSNSTTVRIVNNLEEPLTLSAPELSHPGFAAELVTNQPGKEFHLVVRTVPPLAAGNVSVPIKIKTSSTNAPVINVTAWANFQPVVSVNPSQITLPNARLQNPLPYTLSIVNSGTNLVSLSDPKVSAPGVDVVLKDLIPGKAFSATLNFPAGLEVTPQKPLEFTVKTSHPSHPVLKVPILAPFQPMPVSVVQPPAATPSPQK